MVVVQLIELSWRIYLPAYFATMTGLSLGAVGLLILAMRIFDSVIDPAIAWASDRFPTRYGHRRPWMAASIAPIVLGAAGLFFPWSWSGTASLIACSLLMHLGFMMLVTPHGGWMLELSSDAGERLRIIAMRTWVAIAAMLAVLALPAGLERFAGADREGQVAALGMALIVACPAIVMLTLHAISEPPARPRAGADAMPPWRLFAVILKNRAMPPILLLYLCSGFGEAAASATFLFFVDDALGLRGWGASLLLLQSAIALGVIPLWSLIAERVGRGRLLAFVYGGQALVMPLALLLPARSMSAALMFVVVRGCFAGTDFLLLRVMVADIARDGVDAGTRSGASCYALSNITLKIAMGLGAWVALWGIGGTVDAGLPAAVPEADGQFAVRSAYCLPSLCAALAALAILAARAAAPTPGRREGVSGRGQGR